MVLSLPYFCPSRMLRVLRNFWMTVCDEAYRVRLMKVAPTVWVQNVDLKNGSGSKLEAPPATVTMADCDVLHPSNIYGHIMISTDLWQCINDSIAYTSWRLYSAAPLIDQSVGVMSQYPTVTLS